MERPSSQKSRGFTLIELLVVIAIVSLLASVVTVSLRQTRAKAKDSRRVADLKGLQNSLALYYDQHGAYPVPATSAGTDEAAKASGEAALQVLVSEGLIGAIPKDPGGSAYFYGTDANGTKYSLAALLEIKGQSGPLSSDHDSVVHPAYGFKVDGLAANCAFAGPGAIDENEVCYDIRQ